MKSHARLLLGTVSTVLCFATHAHALLSVTNDEPFSVGYGFGGNLWTTNETAAANTPITASNPNGSSFTVGDFKFTVTIASLANSSQGVSFLNRVLTNGVIGNEQTAQSQLTSVTISGEYTGPNPPLDAEPGPTGFILNIDQISVYAHKHPAQLGGTTNEIWWIESTPGNNGISPSVFTPQGATFTAPSDYAQLSWNPSDFFVAAGTNSTRTFSFPTDRNFLIDGLEIIGSGQYVYMIPEPSSMVLVLATAVFFRRLRNGS